MAQTEQKVGELSKTMLLWALGVTAVLAISLSLFLTRFVTNPIQDLIVTMERAESGLEARVDVKSTDDIGRLGAAFNSLLTKLERARRRVERYHYEQMKRADRLASIGEMAAGIAHEIKNPLAGIAGVIQVLKKDMAARGPEAGRAGRGAFPGRTNGQGRAEPALLCAAAGAEGDHGGRQRTDRQAPRFSLPAVRQVFHHGGAETGDRACPG